MSNHWHKQAELLEQIAEQLTRRIIDEGIEGEERQKILDRQSSYLAFASDYRWWGDEQERRKMAETQYVLVPDYLC